MPIVEGSRVSVLWLYPITLVFTSNCVYARQQHHDFQHFFTKFTPSIWLPVPKLSPRGRAKTPGSVRIRSVQKPLVASPERGRAKTPCSVRILSALFVQMALVPVPVARSAKLECPGGIYTCTYGGGDALVLHTSTLSVWLQQPHQKQRRSTAAGISMDAITAGVSSAHAAIMAVPLDSRVPRIPDRMPASLSTFEWSSQLLLSTLSAGTTTFNIMVSRKLHSAFPMILAR